MKKLLYIILVLATPFLFSSALFAQDVNVISPYIQLQYIKNTNDQRILQTVLTYSFNRMELPIPGMEISFFTGGNIKNLIGTAVTDSKGIAMIELTNDIKLQTDMDGMWAFSTGYDGNDTIEAGVSEIAVKDVILEMLLTEVDSIKTINISAYIIENGSEVPVPDEPVMIYVPRMFSNLLLSELYLDETGNATFEFPSDLPGDKEGNITVVAKFEDNFTFGTVEKVETLKWGLPTDYFVPVSHRALWTKTAPRWMIYSLSVLLAGVWGHYLFALISLIRIKREAKMEEAKAEYRY